MSALVIVLALLVAAIVMFAINKPRLDAVALIMLTALPFTGVLTMGEARLGSPATLDKGADLDMELVIKRGALFLQLLLCIAEIGV